MTSVRLTALLAGCVSLAAVGTAGAGGFSRGNADTDIIFEEGNFNMRSSVTIVSPQREYETITSPLLGGTVAATDGTYSDGYAIPNSAIKLNLAEDLRCAGTYTQSFGSGADYGTQATTAGLIDGTGTISEGFTSNEFGLTCGYKFDLSKGRAWLLGGVFGQDFDYQQTVRFAPGLPFPLSLAAGGTGTLSFDDRLRAGYRIGAAYEIPEIALRAQLMYRSAVEHSPGNGSGDSFIVRDAGGNPLASFVTDGFGTLPQSLELKVQSGIAPGWLAFGSVKWTDWSVLDVLTYNIQGLPFGNPRVLEYYYQDGWTVTGGIGHAFNENISGSMGLSWDRGVSTTEDALTDTYTLFGGVALKDKLGGELRFGGAVTYLTSGSVAADPTPTTPGAGNSFAYTVGNDWSYAASVAYAVNW
jgi:long-chain fatty acid transport protein